MYNRKKNNDPTPLTSDFSVLNTPGTSYQSIIGFGTAGPIDRSVMRKKTVVPNVEKIIENVKMMIKISEKFAFNSCQFSITNMLTASAFKKG